MKETKKPSNDEVRLRWSTRYTWRNASYDGKPSEVSPTSRSSLMDDTREGRRSRHEPCVRTSIPGRRTSVGPPIGCDRTSNPGRRTPVGLSRSWLGMLRDNSSHLFIVVYHFIYICNVISVRVGKLGIVPSTLPHVLLFLINDGSAAEVLRKQFPWRCRLN